MRRAITLTELLIVIGVTMILGWILIPVFTESKAVSSSGQDITNMRDVATALMLYTDDHDDRYVPVGAPATNYSWSPAKNPTVDAAGKPWNGWALKLRGYVDNLAVFRSPLAGTKGSFTGACAHANGMELTSTYSYNWLLGRDGSYAAPGFDKTPSGVRLDRPITADSVHRVGNTIAFVVSPFIPPHNQDRGCLRTTLKAPDFGIRIFIPKAYQDGGSLAFVDGHTRWYPSQGADFDGGRGPIYHWPSRGIWMQPTMPENTLGYKNSDGTE